MFFNFVYGLQNIWNKMFSLIFLKFIEGHRNSENFGLYCLLRTLGTLANRKKHCKPAPFLYFACLIFVSNHYIGPINIEGQDLSPSVNFKKKMFMVSTKILFNLSPIEEHINSETVCMSKSSPTERWITANKHRNHSTRKYLKESISK